MHRRGLAMDKLFHPTSITAMTTYLCWDKNSSMLVTWAIGRYIHCGLVMTNFQHNRHNRHLISHPRWESDMGSDWGVISISCIFVTLVAFLMRYRVMLCQTMSSRGHAMKQRIFLFPISTLTINLKYQIKFFIFVTISHKVHKKRKHAHQWKITRTMIMAADALAP